MLNRFLRTCLPELAAGGQGQLGADALSDLLEHLLTSPEFAKEPAQTQVHRLISIAHSLTTYDDAWHTNNSSSDMRASFDIGSGHMIADKGHRIACGGCRPAVPCITLCAYVCVGL